MHLVSCTVYLPKRRSRFFKDSCAASPRPEHRTLVTSGRRHLAEAEKGPFGHPRVNYLRHIAEFSRPTVARKLETHFKPTTFLKR